MREAVPQALEQAEAAGIVMVVSWQLHAWHVRSLAKPCDMCGAGLQRRCQCLKNRTAGARGTYSLASPNRAA